MHVFLYFLDRELLDIHKKYGHLRTADLLNDMRTIICVTEKFEELIVSASFFFETNIALKIYRNLKTFFLKEKIRVANAYGSLVELVYSKQEQYPSKVIFPFYYDESYLDNLHPIRTVSKKSDTTIYISEHMPSLLKNDIQRLDNSDEALKYILDDLNNRKKKAITHHLFENTLRHIPSPMKIQWNLEKTITELYIKSYMDAYNATIPIGLESGNFGYDYLSKNAVLFDLFNWRTIFRKIEVYEYICKCKDSVLYDLIGTYVFRNFIKETRKYIELAYSIGMLEYAISNLPVFNSQVTTEEKFLNRLDYVTQCITDPFYGNKKIFTLSGEFKMKEKTAFVVYGRNLKAKEALFRFLRAIDILPLEWEKAVRLTQKGSPSILEIINAGMKSSHSIIVLFSGDDDAMLREKYWDKGETDFLQPQPRPNVLFEAGMAMGLYPDSTIIVKIGPSRLSSDLSGIHYIDLRNDIHSRQAFINRLKTVGFRVDDTGNWIDEGDFDV